MRASSKAETNNAATNMEEAVLGSEKDAESVGIMQRGRKLDPKSGTETYPNTKKKKRIRTRERETLTGQLSSTNEVEDQSRFS